MTEPGYDIYNAESLNQFLDYFKHRIAAFSQCFIKKFSHAKIINNQ